MTDLSNKYVILDKSDRRKLRDLLCIHGNLGEISKATGLNVITIKRAKDGLRIETDTADTLRKFLTSI